VSLSERVGGWFDIREGEGRLVGLSFVGAFLVMSFVIVARALREGFYYGTFDPNTMPYITAATVGLGMPAAAWFGRVLTRVHPLRAVRRMYAWLAVGLLVLLGAEPLARNVATALDVVIVGFYLWTAVGSLLVASGFWLVVAELFAVRQAKRLFGLISTGGALGTLTGTLIGPALDRTDPVNLVPVLVVILVLSDLVGRALPSGRLRPVRHTERSGRERAFTLVWKGRHLRLIALIVVAIGVATTLIHYQFVEAANAAFQNSRRLAAFFGAVYGWTGGLALLVQLGLTSRILGRGGVGWSLAMLPAVLLVGSAGMLLAPGIVAATFLRGTDNAMRKSLFRSVMEFLWVPVPASLRRKTKTFIDSTVDSIGEGLGALVVFLWVTLPGFDSRYLSVFVVLLLLYLLYLARRMDREYFVTLRSRLEENGEEVGIPSSLAADQRDLLNATLTRLDITRVFASTEIQLDVADSEVAGDLTETADTEEEERLRPTLAAMLRSGDTARIAAALNLAEEWKSEHVSDLTRLLARDRFVERALDALVEVGPEAVALLAEALENESGDFVIRRRIPRALARIDAPAADEALARALSAGRFEIRYRAALALQRRRAQGMEEGRRDWRGDVWSAVRAEVGRERPVWELARLLDGDLDDEFIERRVGVRGELSLEHTFRLLSLVLESKAVRTAYHGIVLDDPELKSFALEYLEQVLPLDVRNRLWPFIGDLSASQERRALRELDSVVSDLLRSGATLFASEESRRALRRVLDPDGSGESPEDSNG
jgi:hypothetical protein